MELWALSLLLSPAFGRNTLQICSLVREGPRPGHLPLQTRASTTAPPNLFPKHKPSGQPLPGPQSLREAPSTIPFPFRETSPSVSNLSLDSRATPPSDTENLGTRHSRPIPRPRTPDRSIREGLSHCQSFTCFPKLVNREQHPLPELTLPSDIPPTPGLVSHLAVLAKGASSFLA